MSKNVFKTFRSYYNYITTNDVKSAESEIMFNKFSDILSDYMRKNRTLNIFHQYSLYIAHKERGTSIHECREIFFFNICVSKIIVMTRLIKIHKRNNLYKILSIIDIIYRHHYNELECNIKLLNWIKHIINDINKEIKSTTIQ